MNLHPQSCENINSTLYKDLCNTSQIREIPDEGNARLFTGLPAADILILEKLDDSDLVNVCSLNSYLNNLCNNESFWLNRTLSKYGYILGSGEQIRTYLPEGTSWKEYYLWLSDLSSDVLKMMEIQDSYNRPDLQIILDEPIYISQEGKQLLNLIWRNPLSVKGITTRRIMARAIQRAAGYMNINEDDSSRILSRAVIPRNRLEPGRVRVLETPAVINRLTTDTNRNEARNGM
ncbi:MAG: hypothetical protein KGD61_07640 [Candidatus Lokiarchaeota archaeon]|nr:hypothetical protein [Candidatus Lokiarchaeota archaeon]